MYLAKTLQGLSSSKTGRSVMTYAISGRNRCKIEESVVSKLRDQDLPLPAEVLEVGICTHEWVYMGMGRFQVQLHVLFICGCGVAVCGCI